MSGKISQTRTKIACFLACAEPALHVHTRMYTYVTWEHEGDGLGDRRWPVGGDGRDNRSEYGPVNEVFNKKSSSNPSLHK